MTTPAGTSASADFDRDQGLMIGWRIASVAVGTLMVILSGAWAVQAQTPPELTHAATHATSVSTPQLEHRTGTAS
jgi:hypothetical protein